ncbi:Hypothetical protein ADU72_1415 [Pediococcus damnosus]|uniref:Uncharacterized protein n=1 Tax=Pediococcus damnosus TaxID=51663 RepID=A0A0R2HEU2_9LACO|nr:hypothetical protein [Pediococcus damnosus]AMV60245.1 Hypothetical protein ADU69_0571 [Pediococcus damnosus]AMV62771.1 Hypothetical protein ADU70_1281 [Pediococcus damnosus]AMV64495.1 Hypothetical protein ADU71_0576 [Pediococcus damnosus]AMV67344.1 Hypothetical protein ADU72_1415 [Pediococcus damnosus]AMV69646.1 Hypothetical protein ADU73_1248 [Pediococcus damnosus]
MKPGKIILLGIIGAVIIGLLVVITTLLPTTFISQQSLIDVVGIVMFAGFGFYIAKIRDKVKK